MKRDISQLLVKSSDQRPRQGIRRRTVAPLVREVYACFEKKRTMRTMAKGSTAMEPGKRIGHVSVCFEGKLIVWGGYNVSNCQSIANA